MKPSTLNTLLVAKSIFSETKYLVNTNDKHSCTAGIILLQDFVELVVLAALDELDIHEQRNLESKTFDQLLGELKSLNAPVIKSGTIKALNKQRVISKHYGQLSEPASVINYFNTAIKFTDSLLEHVVGKRLQEILLTDILTNSPIKDLIKEAIEFSERGEFLNALIELRKSFYIAYEHQYCVYHFRNRDENQTNLLSFIGLGFLGGMKANHWTRYKQWIDKNVNKPTDYIQINHDQLKTDCMEWGVSTVEIENFRRLTPEVVETEKGNWHFEYETSFLANELNIENFNYCLDIIIDFLFKKQQFDSSKKWPKKDKSLPTPPIYVSKPIFEKPSQTSTIIDYVKQEYYYSVDKVVSGFDSNEKYLYVHLYPQNSEFSFENHIWGYLLVE